MIQLVYHQIERNPDMQIRPGALVPTKTGSDTCDLCASHAVVIYPHKWAKVWTGVAVDIPAGLEGQIRTCHHLAEDRGLVVMNSPGTVPSIHKGELYVLVENRGDEPLRIESQDRLALLAICPISPVSLVLQSQKNDG